MPRRKTEGAAAGIRRVIHYRGKPVASIQSSWTSALKRAGISRSIRPYDLRHAFATELIAQGIDIGTIAKLMGCGSPAMIYKHYQYVMDKRKQAAVESLPDIKYVPKKTRQTKKGPRPQRNPLKSMEPLTRIELVASSLPRMRSAD